jgi:hypothetical protein
LQGKTTDRYFAGGFNVILSLKTARALSSSAIGGAAHPWAVDHYLRLRMNVDRRVNSAGGAHRVHEADAVMPRDGNLVDSRLGYYIRAGKHSMTPEDWKVFVEYANKQLATK